MKQELEKRAALAALLVSTRSFPPSLALPAFGHVQSFRARCELFGPASPLYLKGGWGSPNVLSAFPPYTLGLGLSYVQIFVCLVAGFLSV